MWYKFIRETNSPSTSTNQSFDLAELKETIQIDMEQQITELATRIQELTVQLNSIQRPVTIEEYKDVNVTVDSTDNYPSTSIKHYQNLTVNVNSTQLGVPWCPSP